MKIAIVGMEAVFGTEEGLHAFDRTVFDGVQHGQPNLPEQPRKVREGIKSQVKEDYLRILDPNTPPSADTLTAAVVAGALGDTPAGNPTVDRGNTALVVFADHEPPPAPKGFALLARESSLAGGIRTSGQILQARRATQVVLAAAHVAGARGGVLSTGEGACALLLKEVDQARRDGDRIYATIDACEQGAPSSEEETEVCTRALAAAGLTPGDIRYFENAGADIDGVTLESLRAVLRAYETGQDALTCALGSIQTNFGPTVSQASMLAALVKAALCLYHRYIPATPHWHGTDNEASWGRSPFYVPIESRPWFLARGDERRSAAVHCKGPEGTAHLILSEDTHTSPRRSRYLALVAPYLLPIFCDTEQELSAALETLRQRLADGAPLPGLAQEFLDRHTRKRPETAYALVMVGHGREELLKEIQFMQGGVPRAFAQGRDVKTPKGSYFTPKPLGGDGSLAFVYPGVGSAYVGLGQAIFHLFPGIYEPFSRLVPNVGELLKERELYPRTRHRLTEDDIWKRELRLRKDIMTIGESGMGFFVLYTMILKDMFQVTPACALGYSMGEPGMMASLDVWQEPGELADKFARSPIFTELLNGPLTAVRAYWGLGAATASKPDKIWDSYTLQATPSQTEAALQGEDKVFMTIVNTPEEVVIGGDPEGCMRVVKRLDCKYYPLGLNLAIHSQPARQEYDHLVGLYTLPIRKGPGIRFYSSSCYKAIPIRSKAVAHSIAKAFCERVDFPRLVNQTYEDGARIFIEIGSRKFCSNLIDKILKDKNHIAISINTKGTKDQTSIARVLAQLVSHRVSVDLSPLF